MRRGSITVYLSLVLLIILSLLFVTLRSARIAAGRVAVASGAEQGLYSLFARYDRTLFEKYGLLFVDAGYGSTEPDPGRILDEIEEDAACICQPNRGRWTGTGRDILGIEMHSGSILGYTLATDGGGAPFRRQVCEVMLKNLGTAGLSALRERMLSEEEEKESILQDRTEIREEDADKYYAEDQAAKKETDGTGEIPENFENPLDAVSNLRKLGLLGMVLPRGASVSAAEIDPEELVSGRELHRGMGLVKTTDGGADEKLLLQEYLVQFFPSFTDGEDSGTLRYQVEYAIGRKDSDAANLKKVIRELLLTREASNMLYLMTDKTRRAEADAAATVVSLILLMPEAEPLLSFLIKAAWAYGEAVRDVRDLLGGGRVPLRKTADTWNLTVTRMASAFLGLPDLQEKGNRGLDYEEYLRLLLLTKSADSVTKSLMDLTELNMRQVEGKEDFSLDVCLDSIEVEICAAVGTQEIRAARRYGYEEE